MYKTTLFIQKRIYLHKLTSTIGKDPVGIIRNSRAYARVEIVTAVITISYHSNNYVTLVDERPTVVTIACVLTTHVEYTSA